MNLEKIKAALNDFVQNRNLKLFDIAYRRNDNTLSVLLDEKLSMDELEVISAEISKFLDQYDGDFEGNYFLDVSTVGVERPIRNEEELKEAIGSYIYVKEGKQEYYGTLNSFEDGIMELETKDKNRSKLVKIEYQKAKGLRYAVRF